MNYFKTRRNMMTFKYKNDLYFIGLKYYIRYIITWVVFKIMHIRLLVVAQHFMM